MKNKNVFYSYKNVVSANLVGYERCTICKIIVIKLMLDSAAKQWIAMDIYITYPNVLLTFQTAMIIVVE